MSVPTLSVRVAFASNPFDAALTWTEIGPAAGAGPGGFGWVRELQTKRGRQRLLRSQAQFQAGTLAGKLDNRDRRFDPTNTAGPYYPNVQPEKVVQVQATWQGTAYPIWTGYVDDWPQDWPGWSEGEVPLVATDLFKHLSFTSLWSSGYQRKVLADGATAFYRLDEPTGATHVTDLTGNNADGIIGGTANLGVTGPMVTDQETALDVAPSNNIASGWVSLPPSILSAVAAGTAWTVEMHVKLASGATLMGLLWTEQGQFFGGTGAPANQGLGVTWGALEANATEKLPADGAWHHIAITYTGTALGGIYLDGQPLALSLDTGAIAATALPAHVILGGVFGGSSPAQLAGTVANLAVYPTCLTATQVEDHYLASLWPSQKTGAYVNQILDLIGFPSGSRTIDTGYTLCQADVQNETQTKALDQLQKLEQTEQGQFYIAANGDAVFEDRYHRYRNPDATSQATFGDGGSAYPTEIPYSPGAVVLNFDRTELFNLIMVTRRGGTQQTVSDQASVDAYGSRMMPGLSDLLMADDADALYCAQWILAETKDPQFRIGDLILNPHLDDRLWPLVLGLDLGQVVTVNKHNIPGGGPALSITGRIEGVEHDIRAPHGWTTTWHLSYIETFHWLILDDPVTGLLDEGNRWGW